MESSKKKASTTEANAAPAAAAATKRRPLKTFTIHDVSASVWSRDHLIKGEFRRFYSVTFERSYRDGNGQYRYSRSFNPDDLGALVALCQQTSEFIVGLQNEQAATVGD